MTLRHMKIYLVVYQTENITKAAEKLCMAQPAVTRAIQELENYYGVRLFDRINRHLYRTEIGKMFYNYALHIVDSFDQMEKGLRNWDELGVLRVGTSITIGNALLPKVLTRFRKEHPALRVEAKVSNGAYLQQALLDNALDFALIEGRVNNENLCKEILTEDRLLLILPPEDVRAHQAHLYLQDLAQDDLILREEGSTGRALLERVYAMHDLPLVPLIESVSTQAIIQMVQHGLGISFLPERLVRPAAEAGQIAVKELEDEKLTRENYIVWHKQKFLTPSAQALMDTFRQMVDTDA